jgi:hypothetical protein
VRVTCFVAFFALLALACAAGASDVPDPNRCSVEPWDACLGALTCPFGSASNAPRETASASGQVTFNLPLGGCTLADFTIFAACYNQACER